MTPNRQRSPRRPLPAVPLGWLGLLILGVAALGIAGCAERHPSRPAHPAGSERHGGPRVIERGIASWYGGKFHGRATASGERYDMHGMTAAHKTLPFGTVVEVHDLDNGRRVQVRITDRGPFVRGRILDLSYAAAKKLDMIGPGTARVELLLVSSPRGPAATPAVPPVTRASGPWTVQVGAFEDAERAKTLRDLLTRHYPNVTVRTDGPWHRVQVGSFKKRKKADALRRDLEDLGWDAVVVERR